MAANPTFHLDEEHRDGATVVRARGRFDAAAGRAIEGLLPARGPCVLALDGVDYISSSGVAALVKLSTTRGVRLARPAPCVRDVLSLAGVERILAIHDDVDAALRGAAGGEG